VVDPGGVVTNIGIAADLDEKRVLAMQEVVVDAIDHWVATKGGGNTTSRELITVLLIDICKIIQDAPVDMKVGMVSDAMDFLLRNGGVPAPFVLFDRMMRPRETGLADIKPEGSA
jgi:hypothetical protein